MFYINIDYPTYEQELQITRTNSVLTTSQLKPLLTADKIVDLQKVIENIPVSDHVVEFAVQLVRSTRPHYPDSPEFIKKWVNWGAGPRASQFLIKAARTRAALHNRYTPAIEDVKAVAEITLQHRILVSFAAEAEGLNAKGIIKKLLSSKKN
jgi:MoxR-like ATPase